MPDMGRRAIIPTVKPLPVYGITYVTLYCLSMLSRQLANIWCVCVCVESIIVTFNKRYLAMVLNTPKVKDNLNFCTKIKLVSL